MFANNSNLFCEGNEEPNMVARFYNRSALEMEDGFKQTSEKLLLSNDASFSVFRLKEDDVESCSASSSCEFTRSLESFSSNGGILYSTGRPAHASSKPNVTFEPEIVTEEIPSCVFEDELSSLWYTQEEMEVIEKSCRETIELIRKGNSFSESNEEYCKRGLESHLHLPEATAFIKSKEDIINEVLDKQIDLWDAGLSDQTRLLAEVYYVYSCQHAFKALVMALHDWRSVHDKADSEALIREISRIATTVGRRPSLDLSLFR